MEHQYAQALWRIVEKGKTPKDAVANLRKVLERHGRMRLLSKIGRAFARIAARESDKRAVVLSVAHAKDEAGAKRAAKEALRAMDSSALEAEVRLDSTLIGGWRLEGRERLVDASFKKYLLSLYNRATQ